MSSRQPHAVVPLVTPSIAFFTSAFPGQAVVQGRPNRARRAAHCARGAEVARRSGNRTVEAAWLAVLDKLLARMDARTKGASNDL